jgi:tRNA A-37 threonylcarbamoyl transferase component Bud32
MQRDGYRKKFEVHPDFNGIKDYALNIDSIFPRIGSIVQNYRNDIRIDNVDGMRLVIKSFKGMYWPNRLAYSIFRKSKARRSFENSIRLGSMGFHVPKPVAYIDYYKWGVLQSSYYISLFQEHEHLETFLSRDTPSHELSALLGGFIFKMHQSGIFHGDLSKGNILCVARDNNIIFSMVDLNRVWFGRVSYQAGLKSLSKLGIRQSELDEVVKTYTKLWGQSFMAAIKFIKGTQVTRDKIRKVRLYLKGLFFLKTSNT